jgi:hypothetical protein
MIQLVNSFQEKFEKLSPKNKNKYLEELYTAFYGGEEVLKKLVAELQQHGLSDEAIGERLSADMNMEFMMEFTKLFASGNFTVLMDDVLAFEASIKTFADKINNPNTLFYWQSAQEKIAHLQFKWMYNIEFSGKSKAEQKEILKALPYTTKEKIAKEFDVNKRTLGKWLNYSFGDRFTTNQRSISLGEYIAIFEAFFLYDDEEFNLNNDFGEYLDRKDTMHFTKSQVAEMAGSDLKTQKGMFREMALYNTVDKFPPAIVKILLDGMDGDRKQSEIKNT